MRALISEARGTLLHDQWWKSWVPPISPAKSYLQLLVPDDRVEQVEQIVIKVARLDQQATGAVFSTVCSDVEIGPEFTVLQSEDDATMARVVSDQEELSAIFCVVSHQDAERVAKAAIRAGAHGPIVHYSEGRGLRDRLGWMRITKDHEKEVLMVIAEKEFADDIFDTLAHVARLHLPGRGFMYRVPISKGMYNLRSRTSHHHHDASIQQIIHAIDHLAGHKNWRDQSVYELPGQGRAVGLKSLHSSAYLYQRSSLNLIVARDHAQSCSDMLLEAGASGLNIHYAREYDPNSHCEIGHAQISQEFAIIRCIDAESAVDSIMAQVRPTLQSQQIGSFALYRNPVPTVATYVPSGVDHRAA
ncbi:MAG: hypothetical protein AAF420_02700 [Pseudomonadota bacterium]